MKERRGRFGARHERRSSMPRAGGWTYNADDDTHYGAGAMVCRMHTGDWAVYDYCNLPTPFLISGCAEQAKGAWDQHVNELHRESTEDRAVHPPASDQA